MGKVKTRKYFSKAQAIFKEQEFPPSYCLLFLDFPLFLFSHLIFLIFNFLLTVLDESFR